MDTSEARSILQDFILLDINQVGTRTTSFANPIFEINKRNRMFRSGTADLIPDDIVARRISGDEARVLKFIQYTSRWLPANPSKKNIIESAASTYVSLTAKSDERSVNIANILRGKNQFAFDDALETTRFILLSGVRGIGKTSFMNHWLNIKTRDLEADKQTWFRIDATKVHQIWQLDRSRNITDLFFSYYVVHSLYVILRYSGALAEQAPNVYETLPISRLFKSIVDQMKLDDPDKFRKCCNLFIKAKKSAPVDLDASVDIVQRIITEGNRASRNILTACRKEVSNFFDDNGLGSLIIIDGIDNIAWTKRNTFYRKTCNDFRSITRKLTTCFGLKFTMILAARPETIFEIRHATTGDGATPTGFNWQRNHGQLQEWRIEAPSAKDVLSRKISAALRTDLFHDQRIEAASDHVEEAFLDNILREIEIEVMRYPEAILNNISEAMQASLKGKTSISIQNFLREINSKNLLKFVFDDDLRAYLDNVLKVFFIRRHLLNGQSFPVIEFQKRVMQFIFLNGRPFFNSREQYTALDGEKSRANYEDRGMVFPNLFWWPIELTQNMPAKWHGLAGIRMMQLAERRGNFCCGDMIFAMQGIFGYSVNVLVEVMESLVAFGLIDISTDSPTTYFEKSELSRFKLHEYSNMGHVTAKGIVLTSILFTRPDILYFYGLDTPLKYDLVVEDTRLIKSFFEFTSGDVEDDFFSAAIPTVATFLLHIHHFDKQETTWIKSKKFGATSTRRKCADYIGGKDDLLQAIKLPSNIDSTFLNWAVRGMQETPKRSKEKADEILRNIIGIFGGYTRKNL